MSLFSSLDTVLMPAGRLNLRFHQVFCRNRP